MQKSKKVVCTTYDLVILGGRYILSMSHLTNRTPLQQGQIYP